MSHVWVDYIRIDEDGDEVILLRMAQPADFIPEGEDPAMRFPEVEIPPAISHRGDRFVYLSGVAGPPVILEDGDRVVMRLTPIASEKKEEPELTLYRDAHTHAQELMEEMTPAEILDTLLATVDKPHRPGPYMGFAYEGLAVVACYAKRGVGEAEPHENCPACAYDQQIARSR